LKTGASSRQSPPNRLERHIEELGTPRLPLPSASDRIGQKYRCGPKPCVAWGEPPVQKSAFFSQLLDAADGCVQRMIWPENRCLLAIVSPSTRPTGLASSVSSRQGPGDRRAIHLERRAKGKHRSGGRPGTDPVLSGGNDFIRMYHATASGRAGTCSQRSLRPEAQTGERLACKLRSNKSIV